ncbi:PEP-CTERM sorting domain-containing protein [Phycisphaeraceae bacterium D3-23]
MWIDQYPGRICLLATAVSLPLALQAHAGGGILWDPAGGSGDLADPGNWAGGFPAPSGNAVFDDAGGATTGTLSLPTLPVGSISFTAGDVHLDLGGNHLVGSGPITAGTSGGTVGVLLASGGVTGSSLSAGDGAGGQDVTLTAGAGGVWDISGALTALSDTTLVIDGGTVSVGALSLAHVIDFQSGLLVVNGDLSWSDLGSPAALTIDPTRTLTTTGALTLGPANALTVDGGTLTVGSFVSGSSLSFQSGELAVTNGSLGIGAAHAIAVDTTLVTGDRWAVSDTLTVNDGFSLAVDGGTVEADDLTVAGTYTQTAGSTTAQTFITTATGAFTLAGGTLTIGQVAGNAGTFSMTGPATLRLTDESFDLGPGEHFGGAFTVADGGTLRADQGVVLGSSGPGTLTLAPNAQLQTTTLDIGDQTTLVRDASASVRVNTIRNAGTTQLETIAGWQATPWTASSMAVVNTGTLTHSSSSATTLAARIVGGGLVDLQAGTFTWDTRAAAFDWTTQNTFQVAAGAELAFHGVFSPSGSFADMTVTDPGGIDNDGVLRLIDQHLILRSGYTGDGTLVLEQDARLSLDPTRGPFSFAQLDTTGLPSVRRLAIGASPADVTIHRSVGMNIDFGPGIEVTFVEDVTLTGGVFNDAITNQGVLRLAPEAVVSRPPDQVLGDEGLTVNESGASILLAENAVFQPLGRLRNDGLIEAQAGASLVFVRELEGTGVIGSGDGMLELRSSDISGWQGTFAGNGDSVLTVNGGTALTGPVTVDTAGDLWLRGINNIALDTTLRVGGLLTIDRRSTFTLDVDTTQTVDLHDVRFVDGQTWVIESAAPVAIDSLTIHDDLAGTPGHLTVDYDGELTIGAGGIIDGFGLTLTGGGTVRVLGPSDTSRFTLLEGTLELHGGMQSAIENQVLFFDDTHLINQTGSTIENLLFDTAQFQQGRFTNHGTVGQTLATETINWSAVEVTNHGTIEVGDGQTQVFANTSNMTNHGIVRALSGSSVHFQGLVQSSAGSLIAHSAAVSLNTDQGTSVTLNGSIDLTGSQVTVRSDVLIEAGTAVTSLGHLTSSGNNTLTGFTGSPLNAEDVSLPTRLNTASNLTDPLRVNGTLRSGGGGRMSLPTLLAGTLSPGDPNGGRYGNLLFDRDVTFEASSRFEVEFADGPLHDRIRPRRDLTIEAGATLDLLAPSLSGDPYTVGTTLVLIDGLNPIVGSFDTVLGLDLGNGTQWRLIYDEADLLLEVALLGDIDGDGFVGAADLDVLLAQWRDTVAAGTGADLTGDGRVGQADLDIVAGQWGQGTAPGPNVPEPGSLALLLAGGALLQRRRRSAQIDR